MPRTLPTTTIDIIYKPDAIPLDEVLKFRESRNASKLFQSIKEPVWGSIGDSVEDFYFNARKEHQAMIEQKNLLFEHKKLQNWVNKSRLQRLIRNQANLKQHFIQVNVFLREFMEKRKEAIKMGMEELATQKQLTASNNRIQKDYNVLSEFRKIISATKDEYEPYEKVLDDVVKQSNEVKSVKDLMDRCDALMLAQVEINELNNTKSTQLEEMRKRLVAIANAASLQILGLKNELSNVDRMYEAAHNEVLKWEKIYGIAREKIIDFEMKKDTVREGIAQVYRLLCHRIGLHPDIPYDAIEARLDFIKDEVELMQEFVQVTKAGEHEEDVAGALGVSC